MPRCFFFQTVRNDYVAIVYLFTIDNLIFCNYSLIFSKNSVPSEHKEVMSALRLEDLSRGELGK